RDLSDGERPWAPGGRGGLVPGAERGGVAGVLGVGVRAVGPLVAQGRLPAPSPRGRVACGLAPPHPRPLSHQGERGARRDARMPWLLLIPTLLLAAAFCFARRMYRRGLDRWIVPYLVQAPNRRLPAP